MAYNTIDSQKTGLLFFDMYNAANKGADEATQERMKPVITNCVRLRAACKEAGVPSFYVRADHRSDGSDSALLYTDTDPQLNPWPNPEDRPFRPYLHLSGGTWRTEIIDELKPDPEDYVFPKHRWSAFYQTSLELSLRIRGIDTLLVCGGATEIGVASTAYAARDLDFNLVIVRDCCSSSKQDNHSQFMDRIFPIMARVRTVDQVLQMIKDGVQTAAQHPV